MPDGSQADANKDGSNQTGLWGRIARALLAARISILTERVWPALWPLFVVVGVFCIVSWMGLWPQLNPWLRIAIVSAFGLAALASLYPLTRVRLPESTDSVARVERQSRLRHRPISSLRDTMSSDDSAEARALWRAHRDRISRDIGRLESGTPAPDVASRDPFALRAIVVLLFVATAVIAGPDRWNRLGQAFLAPAAQIAAETRLDAWVSPPSYTGKPPILLTRQSHDSDTVVSVPEGSELVIRTQDALDIALSWQPDEGDATRLQAEASGTDARLSEVTLVLEQTGLAEIERATHTVALWRFEVVPDAAPTIEFLREPEQLESSALKLSYEVRDDYGVVSAKAKIRAANHDANARPIVPAPELDLTLPQLRARFGDAQTVKDLTAHPWAGTEVIATLEARDDLGHAGFSEPARFTLPERRFTEELARAVVEQRRTLALDRNRDREVWRALEMLAYAPDRFNMDTSVYLGLRAATYRLRLASSDDDLRSVLDLLWDLALFIEDGDLADAVRDLRAAQEALQRALDEGAPDSEIARLVDELRQALNEFMQEMARRAADPGALAELPNMENLQTITPQDLNEMLDNIENMARSGARDQAQELLSQLRNMLENLQQGQMTQSAEQSQMSQDLEQLADMIRRQQELMDQTFRMDQQGPMQQGENQQGQPGDRSQRGQRDGNQQGNRQGGLQDGAEGELEGLARAQRELREQLEQLMRQMQESGHNGQEQFGRAGDAMGNAEGALGQGETGEAVQNQGEALDAMRSGAQQLADQLAQSMGMDGQMNGEQGTDPMGRPRRAGNQAGPEIGNDTRIPGEIDAARARKILNELRKRLSDPARSRIERDYLERLLRREGLQ